MYTTSEVAQILQLPYYKVHKWINKYWDGDLGKEFEKKYSWDTDNSRAISFHTLVEFYVMMRLTEAGVKTKEILKAHKELTKMYNSAFPFALKDVLSQIKTDRKKIYLSYKNDLVTLDGTKQFNLSFIKLFFEKLDFDQSNLATRFWPLGKEKSIIIDPQRKFGHPVLSNKNIYPETIYKHIQAGDPNDYIGYIYGLSDKEIKDAVKFMKAA